MRTRHLTLALLPLLGLQLTALMDGLHKRSDSSLVALKAVLLFKFWHKERTLPQTGGGTYNVIKRK